MANFFAELKRRHVYRVAAAYAVVAWVLLQLVNNVAPVLDLPPWVARAFLLALIVGFPVTVLIAWMQELTPADSTTARTITNKLDWALIGALVVVIVLVSYEQFASSQAVGRAQQEQASAAAARVAASSPIGISIAVLPFANVSADAEQEFFSDGITDEITGAIAKIPVLRIVARTSAFQFKGQNRDIQTIGQQLRATHLIEGSVRKVGTRVRISARLVEAGSGLQLWSESYDRELRDIFAIQQDIAQAIATALRVPLGLQSGETLVRNHTDNLESYQQYLRARALVRARGFRAAIAVLEPIVARDPNYAPAWALLSGAYLVAPQFDSAFEHFPIEEARLARQTAGERTERAAREAIRLDLQSAPAYIQLAFLETGRGHWVEAEDIGKRAVALDPNDTDVLNRYSLTFLAAGRFKDAFAIMQQIQELEPFVPAFNLNWVDTLQLLGRYEDSIPILEAMPPGVGGGFYRNMYLARAYAAAGRYRDAADTLLRIPGGSVVSRESVEDAARLMRTAPAKARNPRTLPTLDGLLHFVYAYVGALDRVMDYPERALKVGDVGWDGSRSVWLAEYAPVRKTERFKRFARNARLFDYWKARGWPDLCHPTTGDDFECN